MERPIRSSGEPHDLSEVTLDTDFYRTMWGLVNQMQSLI